MQVVLPSRPVSQPHCMMCTPAGRLTALLRRRGLSTAWNFSSAGSVQPRGTRASAADCILGQQQAASVVRGYGAAWRPSLRSAAGFRGCPISAAPASETQTQHPSLANTLHTESNGSANEPRAETSAQRSTAYPFTEIEAKWQR